MNTTDDLLARIEALEIHVAHQDQALEDLNATLTAQWAGLDAVSRRVALLQERLGEAEARAGQGEPEAPPPHY